MQSGFDYKVKVRATYKDFLPLEFALDVRYLPNLDGKTKFVDLGTHVFYKSNTTRPIGNFKFVLQGVTDEKVDDDLTDYVLRLKDGANIEDYYRLED